MIAAVWTGLRFARVSPQSDNGAVTETTETSHPVAKPQSVAPPVAKRLEESPKPRVDPLETQQRQSLKNADTMIAENNLDGASNVLREAVKLNGPLNFDIQKKLNEIDESKKNAALKRLRQTEQLLWQRAMSHVASQQYSQAQSDLQKVLALPEGGVHQDEARRYIDQIIPQQKEQNSLINGTKQDLDKGDFQSARSLANQLSQKGGNAAELLSAIDQAEQNHLRKLENQFEQLKQRDDDAAAQQIKDLQPKFQALSSDGGPQSAEAQSYATRIPAAMADIRSRIEKKSAEVAFQQLVKRYQQVAARHDKDGIAAVRGDFQSIVAGGGPFANSARQYLGEIDKQMDTFKAPVQPAPTVTKEAPGTAAQPEPTVTKEDRNSGPQPSAVSKETQSSAADEAAIRAVIQIFFQSWEQRNPDKLRQVWPSIPQRTYGKYKDAWQNLSSIVNQITSENVIVLPGGAKATVNVQSRLEETPKGSNKPKTYPQSWVFSLNKFNGAWLISDAQ